MPFVQMENISLFLRACQQSPLNLHQHDTFLTVDLFEQKDPTQVLQCIGAFSRAAHAASPRNFPRALGPKNSSNLTPQGTGSRTPTGTRDRGASVNSNSSYGRPALNHRTGDSGSGRWSPTKSPSASSPGPVSSWSNKEHEGSTAPAWNIAQYGYLGGASQGNLGIAFGARRQITTSGPPVPNLAGKERLRKQKAAEEERLRQQAEEDEQRRLADEEERAQIEEERRWEEEAERLREKERFAAEDEKRRWEEEERQWKVTEEKRRREEEEAEARLAEERRTTRTQSDAKLRGQFLSQYRGDQPQSQEDSAEDEHKNRIKQLEKELELARQREAEYERERRERAQPQAAEYTKPKETTPKKLESSPPSRQDSWSKGQREVLRTRVSYKSDIDEGDEDQDVAPAPPPRSPRPLPDPTASTQVKSPRPLPNPATYNAKTPPAVPNRTDRFLSSGPTPSPAATKPQTTYSRELGATAERDAEDQRRVQSQSKTKAGGWASKSLLEREMEMERERQREWEEAQKETAAAVRNNDGVDGIGGGVGGRWDVGQWSGFTGGDSQNKGGQGIGAGRRQIVGPRPLPEQPR